jgi:hypothetical protein
MSATQILFLVILTSIVSLPVFAAQSAVSNTRPPGVPHRRQYFYVGGEYVPGGTSLIAHGQIYVEHLVPGQVNQTVPLVFVHGFGMTGTNFLNTPDGRVGWADHFMGLGYEVRDAIVHYFMYIPCLIVDYSSSSTSLINPLVLGLPGRSASMAASERRTRSLSSRSSLPPSYSNYGPKQACTHSGQVTARSATPSLTSSTSQPYNLSLTTPKRHS